MRAGVRFSVRAGAGRTGELGLLASGSIGGLVYINYALDNNGGGSYYDVRVGTRLGTSFYRKLL